MIDLTAVKSVQLEITNRCNAACPQCPRNYFGGITTPGLPLNSWDFNTFKKIANQLPLRTIDQVYFCGTYGDPLMNKHLASMVEWLRDFNPSLKIGIHTNGSIGTTSTWARLAKSVDFVAFSIDGLADTNHIYRRGVKWQRLINNAKTYISAGGTAYWDFIAFRHNQHQVIDAEKFSKELGFKKFSIKRTGRFLNRAHDYSSKLEVYDKHNNVDYLIHLPTIPDLINKEYDQIKFYNNAEYKKTTSVQCNALRISEIYIGADGFVFPCGWLHDRMYGPEIFNHSDYTTMHNLINQAGGLHKISVFYCSLSDIINCWFSIIEKSWSNGQRLERCSMMCGSGLNFIGSQNQDIDYKK